MNVFFLVKVLLIAGMTAATIVYVNGHPQVLRQLSSLQLPKFAANKKQASPVASTSSSFKIPKDVQDKAQDVMDVAEKSASNVLGSVSELVKTTASASAQKASEVIVQTAVKQVIEQIDKLPKSQQDEIRKEICK